MTVNLPLLIFGTITESSSGVDSITVKIRNETTNEVGTATTNSSGLYLIDMSNTNKFSKGYAVGDQITIYTIYSSFEGQITFTITTNTFGYEKNISLSVVTDSELIDYCSVQDVYDELDGKTASDISTARIVKAVRRAEGLIDLKTGTFFKAVTITDEIHTVDRYTIEISADYLDTVSSFVGLRRDSFSGNIQNRVKLDFTPVISISSLSINLAGGVETDSFSTLTENTGSGGDFVLEDKAAGIVDFLTQYPRFGKRSWKSTYITGYDRTSTDRLVVSTLKAIERLTILLASKAIITTKSSGSMFDSTRDVKIGTIEIKGGASQSAVYLTSIEPEIKELWKELGDLGIEVI